MRLPQGDNLAAARRNRRRMDPVRRAECWFSDAHEVVGTGCVRSNRDCYRIEISETAEGALDQVLESLTDRLRYPSHWDTEV